MADFDNNLSLADALTEPPPEIEAEVKRDFIATLEAEKFDDMVGETVGKTDYVPLLDDDDETKAGSQDSKSKPHTDGGQVESTSAVGPAVLENGDHGIEDDSTVSPGEIMDEKMSCKEFLDRNETWSIDDRVLCFESQPMFRPMEEAAPFTMHREDVLSDLLLLPSEMETVPPFTEHFEASKDVHEPHSIVMVPEQPSLGFPYSPAEVVDPSPFITLDSTAESLMNIAATAGGTEPEENWLRAQDAVKGSEASFFVEPSEPNRITDAAELYLSGSPVAAAPTTVPSAVTEPKDETKATDMLQVEPTVSVPAVGEVSVPAVEELMTFEPSVQQHKSALAEPPTASSAPTVVMEQKMKVPEASTPGADSPPVPENLEENKQSPSKPAEHLLKPNEQLPEPSVPKEPLTVTETKETLPEKNTPAADLAIVEELKEEAELSHAHHPEPPQDKSPLKPTGISTAQVRQANKSSDRRFGKAKPAAVPGADVPGELLVGLPQQKSADPKPDPFSMAELGWASGTFARTRTPHKKAAGQLLSMPSEFVESQRDVPRENWDSEGSPVIVKKKKKKPKQKRNQQPRAMELWDENGEVSKALKVPLFAVEPQKPDVSFVLPAEGVKERSTFSGESQRKGASNVPRDTKAGTESHLLGDQNIISSPAQGQQSLKTEGPFQFLLDAKAGQVMKPEETKDDRLLPSKSKNKQMPLEMLECKAEQPKMESPASAPTQTKPMEIGGVDKNKKIECKHSDLRVPLTKGIDLNKLETPLEAKPVEVSLSDENKEIKCTSPKHVAADEMVPNIVQTPSEAFAEEKPKKRDRGEKSRETQNGLSMQSGVLEIDTGTTNLPAVAKRVDKTKKLDSFDKSQETGSITSEPLLKTAADITEVAPIPLLSDKPKEGVAGKNKKADFRFLEQPFVLETQTNTAKLPFPAEADDMAFIDKSKQTGFTALDHPSVADPNVAPVTDKLKKRGSNGKDKKIKNFSEQPVLLEAERDPNKFPAVAGTVDKTEERIFTDKDRETGLAVAELSVENMTGTSPAKVADKPKKRTSDGKNKKVEKGHFKQPFFLEVKENASSREENDKTKTISFTDKGKETGFITAEHLLEGAAATMKVQSPTTMLVTEEPKKGINGESEKAECSISEQPLFLETITDAAKLPATAEMLSKTKADNLMDESKETGFTPDSSGAEMIEKPKKKGNDRKAKKADKGSFEQPPLLEIKTDTSKHPILVEKAETMKEMDFADRGKEPIFTTTGHQPEDLTDTTKMQVPTMKLVTEKPKIKESNEKSFSEQLLPSDYKTDTAKSEMLIKTKETHSSDEGKETDFTTLERLLEDIADTAKAYVPIAELMADKPKKGREGKSKKVEDNAEHVAVLQAKTDLVKLHAVSGEADKGTHPTDRGKETQCITSEHLLEDITDTAKVETPVLPLVTGKPKEDNKGDSTKADGGLKQPFLLKTKAAATTLPGGGGEVADKTKEASSTDKNKMAGFTVVEHPAMTVPSPALVASKSKKRSNDGKTKKAKNASEQPVLLQTNMDENKTQPPIATELEYQMGEMSLVDENQNIKHFPTEHQMLWDKKGDSFTPYTQPRAVGVDKIDTACSVDKNQGLGHLFPGHQVKDEGSKMLPLSATDLEGTKKESGTGGQREDDKPALYEHSVKQEGEEAGVQAFTSVEESEKIQVVSTGDKKNRRKLPSLDSLVKQDVKVGRDEVRTSILTEMGDKGICFTDKNQSPECASLECLLKETGAAKGTVPTDANVIAKLQSSSDAGCISPELTVQWENKAEEVVLQVLAAAAAEHKAKETELGERKTGEQSFPECPVSLEKKADAAEGASETLRDAQTEEISPVDKIKGSSEQSEGDASGKMEAGLKDFQALKSEEDKCAALPQKSIDGFGQKVVKETKEEERVKATEQIKGYMRPTKSRGLPTPPPRSAVHDREKPRQLKVNVLSRQRQAKGPAKPEEIKPVEPVTGSDITAPPNKELPPSPEKKAKPSASTPSAKPAAAKTKPLSTTSPKRPASATPGQNKKPTSPTAGPTSATTPKRPPTSTTRPSTLTPKDTKPKVTEAKSPEKRTSVSKPLSATTPRAAVKGSPTTPKTTTASSVTTATGLRNTATSPPKRPTSIKTETKLGDAKKTPMKSPSDLSRPKSAPASASKSSATTPTATTPSTPASPGVATSRPKPKPAAARPTTALRVAPEAKIPSTFKAPLKTSPVAKPPRPASSVSAPDLKNIRSKIGSTDNIKHQPGGGRAKVEKKPESAGAVRKSEPNAVSKMATTKTTVTKEGAQKQPNGKVQIVSKKANYSHVQSKCGSKDNIKHVPGGGNVPNAPKPTSGSRSQPSNAPKHSPSSTNVQIPNKKVDISKVSSKCGSKTNIKHKPGGGDVKIENQKLNFKEKAQAKVGSLDSVGHAPAGGAVKPEGSEEAAPQNAVAPVPQAGGDTQENGVGPTAPAMGGGDQREIQSFGTQIQETSL